MGLAVKSAEKMESLFVKAKTIDARILSLMLFGFLLAVIQWQLHLIREESEERLYRSMANEVVNELYAKQLNDRVSKLEAVSK